MGSSGLSHGMIRLRAPYNDRHAGSLAAHDNLCLHFLRPTCVFAEVGHVFDKSQHRRVYILHWLTVAVSSQSTARRLPLAIAAHHGSAANQDGQQVRVSVDDWVSR